MRRTQYDYTKGQLGNLMAALLDQIREERREVWVRPDNQVAVVRVPSSQREVYFFYPEGQAWEVRESGECYPLGSVGPKGYTKIVKAAR